MRQDPLLASIGGMLRKFKRAEAWLRHAGLPTFLARVPIWLLCVHYCLMMKGKTGRIARIGYKIDRWLDTITELSRHDKARLELIDVDRGMRNDIESTKKTLLLLRELCVDVGTLFGSIGFRSRILDRTQREFLTVVDESCGTATTLQRALELHDARALALLRQMHDQERKARGDISEAPRAGRADAREGGRCDSVENEGGVAAGPHLSPATAADAAAAIPAAAIAAAVPTAAITTTVSTGAMATTVSTGAIATTTATTATAIATAGATASATSVAPTPAVVKV